MFSSIIESVTGTLTIQTALICTLVSLVLGGVIALIYMLQGNYSKSFLLTLIVLPALVQAVIMLVNGNLGTSVAILGAFSLVRFRSVPGNSKEISLVFFSMVVGLATGMGFLTYAALITLIISIVFLVITKVNFGNFNATKKVLKITIPENLDYTDIFNDIFQKYTKKSELSKVKTTNLGSMFELSYDIQLKDASKEKDMIDEIRCRNGNLTIICSKIQTNAMEL